VVTRRPKGGRERERKREPTGNTHIPAGSLSIFGQRSGLAWVSTRRGFRLDPAGDPTSATSPTPCPDPVVPFPSHVLVAGGREKKKNEREREREREREMRSREIFFPLKGERSSSFF